MRGSPITSRIDYAVAVKKENSVRLIFAHKATSKNILTAKITQTTVLIEKVTIPSMFRHAAIITVNLWMLWSNGPAVCMTHVFSLTQT